MKDLSKLNIIYISGYGRSGSTLLSMLLNTLPDVTNLGEVENLYTIPDNNLPEDWKLLKNKNISENDNSFKIRYSGLSWYFKREKGFQLIKRYWIDLFNELLEKQRTSVFVDASKSTYKSFTRPFYYKKAGAKVKMIHLVRDCKDVAISFEKGRNVSNSEQLMKPKKGGAYRAIFNWFVVNVLSSLVYKKSFPDFYVLNYDELMNNYDVEIKKLFIYLELDLPQNLLNKEKIILSEDISFSGNRVMLNESITIKAYPPKRLAGIKGIIAKCANTIYKLIENGYK